LLGCHEGKVATSSMPDAVATRWTGFIALQNEMNS
jgi:hypothetical protein